MAFPQIQTLLDLGTFYMKSLSVELATHPTFMFKKFPKAIVFIIIAWDFPGVHVVKTSPSNARGAGLIPGRGTKSHMPHAQRNQNIKYVYIVTNSIKTYKKWSTSLNTIKPCAEYVTWTALFSPQDDSQEGIYREGKLRLGRFSESHR